MMNKCKKIGIIGGMGPESTSLLYREIVKAFQSNFSAYRDEDFPEMFIHNLPIPDIMDGIEREDEVKRMLSHSTHTLEQAGSELIVFPCNSLNYFVDYLLSQTDVPILSIVEETSKKIKEKDYDEVLLLSTPTTFDKGLYHRYLDGTSIIRPPNYSRILEVIVKTLKGESPLDEFRDMIETDYKEYEHIVIGCTDLSVLVNGYRNSRLLDSTRCLADAVCQACINEKSF
jgi:aspartate racemase